METTTTQLVKGAIATIFITDMDRAVRFYTEALGFKLAYRADGHWATIDTGDGMMLGLHPAGSGPPTPGVQGGIQIGFNVSAPLEEVVRALEARGISFPNGIHDDAQGGVRLAFFQDPDGNEHYLCESKAR